MLNGKKIAVAMPAYYAEKTVERTFEGIPKDQVDDIILIDDASKDKTVEVARRLDLHLIVNPTNLGFGGNHKRCFEVALNRGADIVVILHPDFQYPSNLVLEMARPIASGECDVVYGSRFLGRNPFDDGMPMATFLANRLSTYMQNFLTGHWLSERHSGYCAFSKEALMTLPLSETSDDFLFNNQIMLQLHFFKLRLKEIASSCAYHEDSSSIGASRTLKFSCGAVVNVLQYIFEKMHVMHFPIFDKDGRKLNVS